MTRALLQAAELAAFAGIAVGAHTYVTRRRRPLADALVATAGTVMRAMVAIADVVAALLYVAFAAAVVPFAGLSPVGPGEVDDVLDTVALFALLVAVVQVGGYTLLHRVAGHLEPWPPQPGTTDAA
jgi:hypothetical protein